MSYKRQVWKLGGHPLQREQIQGERQLHCEVGQGEGARADVRHLAPGV